LNVRGLNRIRDAININIRSERMRAIDLEFIFCLLIGMLLGVGIGLLPRHIRFPIDIVLISIGIGLLLTLILLLRRRI